MPFRRNAVITTGTLGATDADVLRILHNDRGAVAHFDQWLLCIGKSSFGAVSLTALRQLAPELRRVFDAITYADADGVSRFNALYDIEAIAARIRLAFHAARTLTTTCDIVPQTARLLIAEKLHPIASATPRLYPSEVDTDIITQADALNQTTSQYLAAQEAQLVQARELLAAQGLAHLLNASPSSVSATVSQKDRSFHYLPYKFDSDPEADFLRMALALSELDDLELYFNGEGDLTEFRVECFAPAAHGFTRIGWYTPDFLLIKRGADGAIHRALIVEIKGRGYASQPEFLARKAFMQTRFVPMNNEAFGYERFSYLYLTDADPMTENLRKLRDAAAAFFIEEQ